MGRRLGAALALAVAAVGAFDTSSLRVEHALGLDAPFEARGEGVDAAAFEALVAAGGLYRVRIPTQDGRGGHVMTAVRACDLYKSGLKEKIAVHVKEDGSIMGLDYSAPQGPLSITRDCSRPKLNAEGSDGKVKISSSVKVAKESEGQTMPVQVVGPPPPGLQGLKVEGEEGKVQAPQSFLAKYWYLILPAMIIMLLNGGPPPEQGQGGAAAPAAAPR